MSEENLSVVAPDKESKQGKEARRERWAWVEHSIWTDRMLRSLETGIEGGKWFALIDKVYRKENLRSAFYQVGRNAGCAASCASEPNERVKPRDWTIAGGPIASSTRPGCLT